MLETAYLRNKPDEARARLDPEYAVGFLLRPEIAVAACASPVFPSAE